MGHAEKLQNIDYEKKGFRGCLMESIILTLDDSNTAIVMMKQTIFNNNLFYSKYNTFFIYLHYQLLLFNKLIILLCTLNIELFKKNTINT